MKAITLYLLYFINTCLGITLIAQSSHIEELSPLPKVQSAYELGQKPQLSNFNKAPGDTLFYEDFANGFNTNGWTSNDGSFNGFDWIYTTNAPGGQYSTLATALVSATSSNGFASLPSDFYNTPTPPAGFIQMDASLTSGPISINTVSGVLLRWTQSQRYCCSANDLLEVQVSTDSVNWISFDATFGRSPNSLVTETAQIDISAIAANQNTVYIRFYQSASHYYWMVDDIVLIEGGNIQLSATETYLLNQSNQETYYSIYPCFNPPIFTPGAEIFNPSNSNATNVRLSSAIINNGRVEYSGTSLVNGLIPSFQRANFQMAQPYISSGLVGNYEVIYKATSASQTLSFPNRSIPFQVSDSVYARDLDSAISDISPADFLGGSNNGSKLGVHYFLKSPGSISSIAYFVANDPLNVGVVVKASLLLFDTTNGIVGNAIAIGQNTSITANDLGTWKTLPIGTANQVIPSGNYLATLEQVSGGANGEMRIGRDNAAERFAPFGIDYVSSVFVNGSTASWGNIFSLPMIRLNFKSSNNCIVGVEEQEKANTKYTLFPNPSKGIVNIQLSSNHSVEIIEVYSIQGKLITFEVISNQENLLSIDLSDQSKGVYFLRFISTDEIVSQRIVIE